MSTPTPPLPAKRPVERSHHGDTVVDDWEWLRDAADPEVLAHLAAENAWTAHQTAHLKPLEDELFNDVKARTLETDLSVPRFHRHGEEGWWYYRRTIEGQDYPVHCRMPASDPAVIPDPEDPGLRATEQVLFDENEAAAGHTFFSLGAFAVSPNGELLAYSIDTAGDERYELRVRDIATGEDLGVAIPQTGHGANWSGDGLLFYVRVDEAWRPHEVWRHTLGTDPSEDVLVLTEPDEMFWLAADESRDRNWVVLTAGSKLTTEVWLLPAGDPEATPQTVAGRTEGLEYLVEVADNELFIIHNADSPDFSVSRAALPAPSGPGALAPFATWQAFLGPTGGVRYSDVNAYAGHVVVGLRRNGLTAIEIHPRAGGAPFEAEFTEAVHTVYAQGSEDFDTDRVRILYTSLVTPPSVLSLDLTTGDLTTLKTTPVLDHPSRGAYSPDDYLSERIWATAADGTEVPISVVRRRDVPLDGSAPALLYGYGSYEISIDPTFSTMRLSLLDRGFVFAIAHIRGGGELGRAWYENGKMLHKRNTFTDFIAAGRRLVELGYTSHDRLAAQGGSAGGLLMGAVANLAPEVFRAIHASVPFVDALTTILNPELPLTVTEWEEWGDPLHDPAVYAYMKTYSPYENVTAQDYPAILATTSLNDTRVFFVEPAKWVAALRDRATNQADRPTLFRCEMVAGHGGVSGRYNAWREAAFEYAWLIDQVT
ncbi:S9 family peptidase [Granulicoccus sp. GXG6511]|uniref:S9 family peptidase n=1 Tax=Granulicoccus sp. GXG6511 TaxID=3381351 RepID=UPI003D7DA3BA